MYFLQHINKYTTSQYSYEVLFSDFMLPAFYLKDTSQTYSL